MSLTLDGARERLLHPGQTIVECGSTIWIFRYSNGHVVMLRGSMTARHIACSTPSQSMTGNHAKDDFVLRFDEFDFYAHSHDRYIALEAISGLWMGDNEDSKTGEKPGQTIVNASIPGEPVNVFGVPQATMRFLEVSRTII